MSAINEPSVKRIFLEHKKCQSNCFIENIKKMEQLINRSCIVSATELKHLRSKVKVVL